MTDTERVKWMFEHRASCDVVQDSYIVSFVTVMGGVKQWGHTIATDMGEAVDKAALWQPGKDSTI